MSNMTTAEDLAAYFRIRQCLYLLVMHPECYDCMDVVHSPVADSVLPHTLCTQCGGCVVRRILEIGVQHWQYSW